jgi:hypothetical protein
MSTALHRPAPAKPPRGGWLLRLLLPLLPILMASISLAACKGMPEAPLSGSAGSAGAARPAEPSFAADGAAVSGQDLIVVAVSDNLALAAQVAGEHGLRQLKAWSVATLSWRCMLLRLPPGVERAALLQRLQADPRVRLAQVLNDFETLATPAYNDPYLPLQSGFATIDAAGAQRVTHGQGVTIAIIDTGIDAQHPDLQGRVALARDFVGRPASGERHGTEVAGVIAAAANNGIGIVGVAPAAKLLAIRSCWSGSVHEAARCNSFTIAQGLSAAMAAGADVINLSLGGPRDALLEQLTQQAQARGIVVVGALPRSGRREGFPSALPGVLVVASSEDGAPASGVLAAPGRSILTLAPGGGYDYASGSSLATAHVSGAVALLRSVDGTLDGAAANRLLALGDGLPIDACRALQRMDSRVPPACGGTR